MLEVGPEFGIGIFEIIGHLDLLGEIRKMPFGLLVVLVVSFCSFKQKGTYRHDA